MNRMIRELTADPAAGYLGGESWLGNPTIMVQYWASFEQLERYARAADREIGDSVRMRDRRQVGTHADTLARLREEVRERGEHLAVEGEEVEVEHHHGVGDARAGVERPLAEEDRVVAVSGLGEEGPGALEAGLLPRARGDVGRVGRAVEEVDDRRRPPRETPERLAVAVAHRLRAAQPAAGEVIHEPEEERRAGVGGPEIGVPRAQFQPHFDAAQHGIPRERIAQRVVQQHVQVRAGPPARQRKSPRS